MPPESCTRTGSIAVDGIVCPTLTVPPACGVGPVVSVRAAGLRAVVSAAAARRLGGAGARARRRRSRARRGRRGGGRRVAAVVVGVAARRGEEPEHRHRHAEHVPRRIRVRRVMRPDAYASMRLFSTSERCRRTSSTRRWTSFMPLSSPRTTRDGVNSHLRSRAPHGCGSLRRRDSTRSRPTAGLILAPGVAIFKLRSRPPCGRPARRCAGSSRRGGESARPRHVRSSRVDGLRLRQRQALPGRPRRAGGAAGRRQATAVLRASSASGWAATGRPSRPPSRRSSAEGLVDRDGGGRACAPGWGLYLLATRVVGARARAVAPRYVARARGAHRRERLRPAPARPAQRDRGRAAAGRAPARRVVARPAVPRLRQRRRPGAPAGPGTRRARGALPRRPLRGLRRRTRRATPASSTSGSSARAPAAGHCSTRRASPASRRPRRRCARSRARSRVALAVAGPRFRLLQRIEEVGRAWRRRPPAAVGRARLRGRRRAASAAESLPRRGQLRRGLVDRRRQPRRRARRPRAPRRSRRPRRGPGPRGR